MKYNIEDYYYGNYVTDKGYARLSLLRSEGNKYYDVVNNESVNKENVIFTKSLALYVDYSKAFINDKKAKKLAEPHYAEFHVELSDNLNSYQRQQYLGLVQIVTI